jgi:drug/metabolite transporter (DMT)-like permease
MPVLPEWAKTREVRAIAAMCLAMALFAGNDVFNKLSREHWPTGQVLAVRGLLAVSLMFMLVIASGHGGKLKRLFHPNVMLRGGIEGIVAPLFITALGLLPLHDTLAILMASTLIGTALSVPILGEQVGWRRWTAILIGFAGVLLVLQPSGAAGNWGGALALLCAFCVAFRDISTRFVPREIPSVLIAFATGLGAWFGGIALLPFETMQPFTMQIAFYLAGSALFIVCGNYAAVIAFREVEISIVSPFRYTSMIWGTLASGFVFGQWPGWVVGLGMMLIVGSGLYTLHRERVRRRQPLSRLGDERP